MTVVLLSRGRTKDYLSAADQVLESGIVDSREIWFRRNLESGGDEQDRSFGNSIFFDRMYARSTFGIRHTYQLSQDQHPKLHSTLRAACGWQDCLRWSSDYGELPCATFWSDF